MSKVLVDENLSPALAHGLQQLQAPLDNGIEVVSIVDQFHRGVADEDWIPAWGKTEGIFLTQDIAISRRKGQVALLTGAKIGAFFLDVPRSYRYWDRVKIIVERWAEVVEIIQRERRPFAYLITPRGKLKKLAL